MKIYSRIEQRYDIKVLATEKYKPCEIYRRICYVYRKACFRKNVYNCVKYGFIITSLSRTERKHIDSPVKKSFQMQQFV